MLNQIITSTILILFLLLLSVFLERRINPCLKYALWLLVVVKLLIPLPYFETHLSVLNLVSRIRPESAPHRFIDNGSANFPGTLPETEPDQSAGTDATPSASQESPDQSTSFQGNACQENTFQKNAFQGNSFQENAFQDTSSQENASQDISFQANSSQMMFFPKIAGILTALWICGILLCGGTFLWSGLRFQRWLRHNRIFTGMYMDRLSIYEVPGLGTPCLAGVFAPAIYVNREHHFDKVQLSYILAHEYTHFRHGDHIWAVARCICVAIYWYNPFVWLAARRSASDGELACDAGTLKQIGEENRILYAKTLILAANNLSQQTNMRIPGYRTGAAGGMKEMKRRIKLLKNKPRTRLITLAVTLILCCGMIGCTYGSAANDNRGGAQVSPELTDTLPPAAQTDTQKTESENETEMQTESNTAIEIETETETAPEPESASPESMVYHNTTLYRAPEPGQVCILVQPSMVRDYLDYYYIPSGDAQDQLQSLMARTEPDWQKNSDHSIIAGQNLKETGYQLYYEDRIYTVFEGGYLYTTDVDEERGGVESLVRSEALCDLTQQLLSENLGYEPVDITQIHDIVSARLDVCSIFTDWEFYSQTITDPDTLALFEDWFCNARYILWGAGCGNENACLELTLSDGNVIRLSMAIDSCSNFGVNGVYYDYRPKASWDNTAFYHLFDEIPWNA